MKLTKDWLPLPAPPGVVPVAYLVCGAEVPADALPQPSDETTHYRISMPIMQVEHDAIKDMELDAIKPLPSFGVMVADLEPAASKEFWRVRQ